MSYDYPQYNHGGIMSVSVAQHTAGAMSREGNRGRGYDYDSASNSADGIGKCTNYRAQWSTPIASDGVDTVFITGWNEWMALKLSDTGEREVRFTDAFDYEFSRDIEPSLREDGDAYYLETVRQCHRFSSDCSGVSAIGKGVLTVNSDVEKMFAENKAMRYPDLRGDTAPRDCAGAVDTLRYTYAGGGNDITFVNVSNDTDNLYIAVECAEDILPRQNDKWLNIIFRTGGKEYVLNRMERGVLCGNGIETNCENEVCGNRFWVKIPLSCFVNSGDKCALRVTDGVGEGILSEYAQGDSAPLGNLFFEYKFA